jgi:hypothetical protein
LFLFVSLLFVLTFRVKELKRAIEYAARILDMARALGDKTNEARSFMLLARVAFLEKDYGTCLSYREPVEALLEEHDSGYFAVVELWAACYTEFKVSASFCCGLI